MFGFRTWTHLPTLEHTRDREEVVPRDIRGDLGGQEENPIPECLRTSSGISTMIFENHFRPHTVTAIWASSFTPKNRTDLLENLVRETIY